MLFNIGVIARHPSYVHFIRNALTEENVEKYFEHLWETKPKAGECRVKRFVFDYEKLLSNIRDFNGLLSLVHDRRQLLSCFYIIKSRLGSNLFFCARSIILTSCAIYICYFFY